MDVCNRCGALTTALQYAPDGMSYCASCVGTCSRRCQRCSQYVSSSLLQRYRGSRLCSSCVQSVQYEESVGKNSLAVISYPEACSICGSGIQGLVHIWNEKPLCMKCLEEAKNSWEIVSAKPGKGGTRVRVSPAKKKAKRKRKTKRKPAHEAVMNPFKEQRPLLERKPMRLPHYLS